MDISTYIWKSDYLQSIEYAQIINIKRLWQVNSTVIVSSGKSASYKINYLLNIDENWNFKNAEIIVDKTGVKRNISIKIDSKGNWFINEELHPDLKTCIDIDLGFTPLTNTLPIRRLNIKQGQSSNISVAWIQFPSFDITPLLQQYTNVNNIEYIYESATDFKASILVNKFGFVTKYENYWYLIDSKVDET